MLARQLAGMNPYGSVTSGVIKLRSVLQMVGHLTPVIGQDCNLYSTRCSLHADFPDSNSFAAGRFLRWSISWTLLV